VPHDAESHDADSHDADIEVITPPRSESADSAKPSCRDDELLTEIPTTCYHRGRFSGYDAGRRVRLGIAIFAAFGVLCSACAYVWNVRHVEWQRTHPFVLPEGTDLSHLTRTLYWSEGRGRFALDKEAPGVELLVLPDRSLSLAESSDRAQVIVYVEDGVTTTLEVLSGHVVQKLETP
jgi:hypothetical protein